MYLLQFQVPFLFYNKSKVNVYSNAYVLNDNTILLKIIHKVIFAVTVSRIHSSVSISD